MTYCFRKTLKRRGGNPGTWLPYTLLRKTVSAALLRMAWLREKSMRGGWICLRILALRPTSHSSASTGELTSGHNLLDITKENSCFSSLCPIASDQFPTLFSASSTTDQLSCEGPVPGGVGERGLVLRLWAILIGLIFQLQSITPIIVVCSDLLKEGLEVKMQRRMELEVC